MLKLTNEKAERLNILESQLSNPSSELYSNPTKIKALNSEYASLKAQSDLIIKINKLEQTIHDNSEMLLTEAGEMKQLLIEENSTLENEVKSLQAELVELEKPKNPKDFGNCIIEIRAGTGGEEAALFAKDLFRMYTKYALSNGFRAEIMDQSVAQNGGFKEIIFEMSGAEAFGRFKNESGVHRVQRIPATESAGRIHTSTASVVVLPIVEPGEVEINEKDLRIDVYRSSGAGGQGVNTTDSAVRITHIPSGIVVTCQDGRSQLKNKDSALSVLRSKLYEIEQDKVTGGVTDLRKNAIKSGDRSDKIKTYNYPQNRVTDHRAKISWHNLDSIMEGDIDEILKVNIEPGVIIDEDADEE